MSVEIAFTLTLTGHQGLQKPKAFLWVDADRNDSLDTRDIELKRAEGSYTWDAKVEVTGESPVGLLFRVGTKTTPGAKLKVELKAKEKAVFDETFVVTDSLESHTLLVTA
ncbi:MAG: hypothetical protein Q8P41_01925 [Pseudomonadota bacterium]|nr:hypothetical protein [Pseudomonadota bacterium]